MTSSLLLSLTTFAYLLCTVLYLSGTVFRFKPLLGAGAVSGDEGQSARPSISSAIAASTPSA